jgi:hypothetical protein
MRLSLHWRMAALSGALLCGACSKEPAPAPAPSAQPEQAPKPAAEPAAPEQAQAEAPTPESEASAEDAAPPEFKIGQRREEVMRLFGKCAERRAFEPPGPGKLYVEIYQAKDTEACVKRLGERHFLIRGGLLHQITPGLIPPEPPPREPPEGS